MKLDIPWFWWDISFYFTTRPINALTMMLTGKFKPSGAKASGIAHKLVNTKDKLCWTIRKKLLKLDGKIEKTKAGFLNHYQIIR